MNHDNFKEVTSDQAPDFKVTIHFKSAWATGYNTCLYRTNAAELLQALKPFADLLKQFDGRHSLRPKTGTIHSWHHSIHGESELTVEMLQNAYNAIKKATDEK